MQVPHETTVRSFFELQATANLCYMFASIVSSVFVFQWKAFPKCDFWPFAQNLSFLAA